MMTDRAFEHALDDLQGLDTRPPPLARDEPWADAPTQMFGAGFTSERLDAAALFEGVHAAPPPSASELLVGDVVVAPVAPPVLQHRPAAPSPRAPRMSNDSRLVGIAVLGALALVGLLAACNHWHGASISTQRAATEISAQQAR